MLVAFEFVVVREETAIKADRRNTRPGRFASKLQSVVFFLSCILSRHLYSETRPTSYRRKKK